MKYKIQIESVCGWADLKYTDNDGETYQVDLYESEEEAKKELESILESFQDNESDAYRIVKEDVKEDFNIYSE